MGNFCIITVCAALTKVSWYSLANDSADSNVQYISTDNTTNDNAGATPMPSGVEEGHHNIVTRRSRNDDVVQRSTRTYLARGPTSPIEGCAGPAVCKAFRGTTLRQLAESERLYYPAEFVSGSMKLTR